jgi:hypothetical protein
MCEKIISKGSAKNIDPCLVEELEQIKNEFPRFREKFKSLLSCCGHGKYKKTWVVQNKGSKVAFDWFSRVKLTGTKRSDSRAPYYERDDEGHYFIPEVQELVNDGCPMCGSLDYHDYLEGFKCSSCDEYFFTPGFVS